MKKTDVITGLVLDIQEERYDNKDPNIITGLDVTFINVGTKSQYLGFGEWNIHCKKPWIPMFKYHFNKWHSIANHFLVKFQYKPDKYTLLKPYKIIRYDTHEYDVVTVLAQNYNHTQLCLYGEKLGEVIYDTCNNKKFPYIDFINTGDTLVVKFPQKTGNYIQIIDNISYQQRKYDFRKSNECWRPAWARDFGLPKYTFSPTGQLLGNTRPKER